MWMQLFVQSDANIASSPTPAPNLEPAQTFWLHSDLSTSSAPLPLQICHKPNTTEQRYFLLSWPLNSHDDLLPLLHPIDRYLFEFF